MYTVGGTVSGLSGAGLALQNNGGDNLSVSANGAFSFAGTLATGAGYGVTVLSQPTGPWQTCTVTAGGSGTIAGANVSSVVVSCVTNTYTVGGTVAGLEAAGLVLQNNGGDDLAIAADGTFDFVAPVASGGSYSVAVRTQPNAGPTQVCRVSGGSGTITNSAVTSVAVACSAQTGKFLYIPNQTSNDVSAYTIDADTGTLAAVPGSPFAAEAAPTFASADPQARFLYVSNRGSLASPPVLSAYTIDASTGVLTELLSSPFPLSTASPPPNGQALAIGKPIIHPSGLFGYLTIPVPTGRIFGATINQTTGELTEIPGMPITLGWELNGGSFDSAGRFIYFPHINGGLPVGYVQSYEIVQPSGVLMPVGAFDTQGRGGAVAIVTPGDTYLLTPNVHTMNVSVLAMNAAAGTLTPVAGSPVSTGPGSTPFAIAFHRRKNFVYVIDSTGGRIFAYIFTPASGTLTPIAGSPYTLATQLGFSIIDRSGRYLYVPQRVANSIYAYSIDQTTGVLTPVQGTPFATGASPFAAINDPSGRFLYVSNTTSNTVTSYAVNSTTGALTVINTLPTGTSPQLVEVVGLQ